MMQRKCQVFLLMLGLVLLGTEGAHAAGECCMIGNLSAAASAAGLWSLQLQYDYSSMRTIREGREEVSPDEILASRIAAGAPKYAVPTDMVMQKYVLAAQGRPTRDLQVLVTLPYVVNDMDMRMSMAGRMGTAGAGMTTSADTSMARVKGLGDAIVGANYTVLRTGRPDRAGIVAVGLGLKLPTGKNDVKKEGSDAFVHAMMQPGTGSWDPIAMARGEYAAGKLGLELAGTYHFATEGDEGYEFGDLLGLDLKASYQALAPLRLGLGVAYLHAGSDADRDGAYTSPTSMIDNTENTGGVSLSLSPELRLQIPGTGGSLAVALQRPVYQKVQGTQQVLDWRLFVSLGWGF